MGVRHVNRCAFVAHVDDADAAPRDVIPDRLNMAALQAEDAVDAASLQETGDPGRASKLVASRSFGTIAATLIALARLQRGPTPRSGGTALEQS